MSVKDIHNLRREGRLAEAFELAKQELRNEKSEWTYSAMFWVLRDYCEQYISQQQIAEANDCFDKLKQVYQQMSDYDGIAGRALDKIERALTPGHDLIKRLSDLSKQPGQETQAFNQLQGFLNTGTLPVALHEDAAWIIYRYLKANLSILSIDTIKMMFSLYFSLNNPKPSMVHTQMLNVIMRTKAFHPDFILLDYITQWDVDNFTFDDFYSSMYNGKSLAPLVERVIDKCFFYNYSLSEVEEVFSQSSDITWNLIAEVHSKFYFFEIDKKKEDFNQMFAKVAEYLETIDGREICNEYHSRILFYLLWKLPENSTIDMVELLSKWGCENFRKDDWERESKDEHTFPSLAEKAISASIKTCKMHDYNNVPQCFIELLRKAISKYSDNDQLERNLGLILFYNNQPEEALAIYRNLLKDLDAFYVWKELADISYDIELKISALCKALLSGSDDDFLGEVHLKLADLLVANNDYIHAKIELQKYYSTYTRKQWRFSDEYVRISSLIPDQIVPEGDNLQFYQEHQTIAEEFVYADIDWTPIVVIDIYEKLEENNKKVKKVRLANGDGIEVTMKQSAFRKRLNNNVVIGMCVDAKLVETDHSYKCVLLRNSTSHINEILKEVVCYVEYHNIAKKCYHLLGANYKQYLLHKVPKDLQEKSYCLCYEIPLPKTGSKRKHNEIMRAIFGSTLDEQTALTQIPMRTAVVDNVNESKHLFHCVLGTNVDIIVQFDQTSLRPQVGDYLNVKYFVSTNKEGKRHRKLVYIEPTNESKIELRKTITGTISVKYNRCGQEFGFVDDYYVPGCLISDNIEDDDMVTIDVVYNGEKWQAYQIRKH